MFISLFAFNSIGFAWPVLRLTIDGCGSPRNIFGRPQYKYVSKEMANFTDIDGGSHTGWNIDCKGSGKTGCPRHQARPNHGNLDDVDVNVSNDFMDYYEDQVKKKNFEGTHFLKIVDNKGKQRLYTLTWFYKEMEDGEISGELVIDRKDIN